MTSGCCACRTPPRARCGQRRRRLRLRARRRGVAPSDARPPMAAAAAAAARGAAMEECVIVSAAGAEAGAGPCRWPRARRSRRRAVAAGRRCGWCRACRPRAARATGGDSSSRRLLPMPSEGGGPDGNSLVLRVATGLQSGKRSAAAARRRCDVRENRGTDVARRRAVVARRRRVACCVISVPIGSCIAPWLLCALFVAVRCCVHYLLPYGGLVRRRMSPWSTSCAFSFFSQRRLDALVTLCAFVCGCCSVDTPCVECLVVLC